MAGALFDIMAEGKMKPIPYKSGGPAIVDLVGGQVQLYFAIPISILPHVKSGKVKALAVTGKFEPSVAKVTVIVLVDVARRVPTPVMEKLPSVTEACVVPATAVTP